jgi:hypothetical protein
VGVDNEKTLELTNSTVFHRGRQLKSSRAGQQNIYFFRFQPDRNLPKMQSCCIVAGSCQTFWFKLDFLLPNNESVLNILGYFLEQFQIFSWIYPKMFSTDFIFRKQENLVDNQKCQAGFRSLCNKILLFPMSKQIYCVY